jgi:hypothetical protein
MPHAILVAASSAPLRQALRHILEGAPYRIFEARDGEETLPS